VNWGTLAATALGALLGVGSTFFAEHTRWLRDRRTQEHKDRRETYSRYLSTLSLTTHQLNDLWLHGPSEPDERRRMVGEILTTSGAYQLRWRMLITAPEALDGPIEQAFGCLRNLRDRFYDPEVSKDQWDGAIAAISDAIDVLRIAMRDDLSNMVRPRRTEGNPSDRLRLRHHRRRNGRLRAGRPADGKPAGEGAAAGGG
jgi:hypothetical protein